MDKTEPIKSDSVTTAKQVVNTKEPEIQIEELPAFDLALMQQCGDAGNW